MTIQEAQTNIGNPFKWIYGGSGLCGKFDTIRKVENDTIHGDFLEAHHDDCRLKQEQPDHLKQHE